MPVKEVRLCPVGAASRVATKAGAYVTYTISPDSAFLGALAFSMHPGAEDSSPKHQTAGRKEVGLHADLSAPRSHRFAIQEEVSTHKSWGTGEDTEGALRDRAPTQEVPAPRPTPTAAGPAAPGPRPRPWPQGRGDSGPRAPPPAPPRPSARPARLPWGVSSRPAPLRAPAAGLQGWARAPRPGQEDGGERAGAEAGAALQAGDRHGACHPAAAGPGGVELQWPGGGRTGRGVLTARRAGGQAGRGGARGPGGAEGGPGWGSGAPAA